MIALGLETPRPEVRSGYTSQVVNAVETAAAGAAGTAIGTAAVETASGLWGRALALAEVEPMNRRTAAISPTLLAMVGRALCRSGQIVFDIDVAGGALRLLPASAAYVVVGNGDPRTWIYTVTIDGPGNTRTVYRTRDGVVHLQYAVSPTRPWEGRAPWATAGLSGQLLAGIERQLSGEAGSASGYILPTPDVGDRGEVAPDPANPDADTAENDPLTTLRRDLAAAGGKTVLAPTTAAGYGAGPVRRRRRITSLSDSGSIRRARLSRPAAMPSGRSSPPVESRRYSHTTRRRGPRLRESIRLFSTTTMQPIAAMVSERLSESLGMSMHLDAAERERPEHDGEVRHGAGAGPPVVRDRRHVHRRGARGCRAVRLADVQRIQAGLWRRFGEGATVGGVTAQAIWNPEEADVPGAELARRSARVTTLAFRESDGLDLRRGTRILFRGAAFVIDGTPDVQDYMVIVALLPDPQPVTGRSYSTAYSGAYA